MENAKSQDLILIEDAFNQIKQKHDVAENLSKIERVISRAFDIKMKISIIENKPNVFFGMSIYPEISQVDAIVKEILEGSSRDKTSKIIGIWHGTKNWVLEMDSILIYDRHLNASPAEITAVLLHEIGHIIHSNSVPQRISKVMSYEIASLSVGMYKLIRWEKVRRLFALAIVESCASTNFRYINVDKERIADAFVVKNGYGTHLDAFITKLLQTNGNSLINRTDAELDGDVRMFVKWTIDNISELEFRKTRLKKSLNNEMINNPSHYVRRVIADIRKSFFGGSDERYKELLAEQLLVSGSKKIVMESFLTFFDKYGKVKKVTQYDIDDLVVELGRVTTDDDKLYVLGRVYDLINTVDYSLNLIASNKKEKVSNSKETLMGQKNQLDKLRKDVMGVQVNNNVYGVFVKYPKGYEG